MCCGCCIRLHRHQVHLISYGFVSFTLIATGLVFTIFAIFQKDTQIGKVWLAGPTTMVVGLVLCGKVIIDWGPAMMHGREGSVDSFDQLNLPRNSLLINAYETVGNCGALNTPLPYANSLFMTQQAPYLMPQHAFDHGNSTKMPTMVDAVGNVGLLMSPSPMSPSLSPAGATLKNVMINGGPDVGLNGAIDCIVYAPFDNSVANTPSRQSQNSYNSDNNQRNASNNNVFKYDSRVNNNNDNYACDLITVPPPFPLTLPMRQTLLNSVPASPTVMSTAATQTCNKAPILDSDCNCASTYLHNSKRVRCCDYCGRFANLADSESETNTFRHADSPRVTVPLHNAINSRIAPARSLLLGANNNNRSASYGDEIDPLPFTNRKRREASRRSMPSTWVLNGVTGYSQTMPSTPSYTAPPRMTLTTTMNNEATSWAGLLYQGETFVLNERNFFI